MKTSIIAALTSLTLALASPTLPASDTFLFLSEFINDLIRKECCFTNILVLKVER
jgi:hypothetical protein